MEKPIKNDPILQPVKLNNHLVPGLWRYFLPKEVFSWNTPQERQSTCMKCPKIATDGFRKDYRCCTYQPAVPNFSLGLALKTEAASGPVRQLISRGNVLPEGSLQTPHQWYQYLTVTKSEKFGNSDTVLCSLLDESTGYCNIYAFRNSICSTFFCLHDHGTPGNKFWDRVQEMVGQVENCLAQWALQENGFDLDHYFAAFNEVAAQVNEEQSDKGWSASIRAKLWGEWFGREEELLTLCAAKIMLHRDELWDIANAWQLREASEFEKAQISGVPKELESEVDPADYQEEGEPVPPKDLLKACRKSHKKLWDIPDQKLVLNPRVEISKNTKDDAESKHYKSKSYEVMFLTKKDADSYDWRQFVAKKDVELLKCFKKPRALNKKLMSKLSKLNIKYPDQRIAEWFGLKVLVKAKET